MQAAARCISARLWGEDDVLGGDRGCTGRGGGGRQESRWGEGVMGVGHPGRRRVFRLIWAAHTGPRAGIRGADSTHHYHPISALEWSVQGTNICRRYMVRSCPFFLCLCQNNKKLTGFMTVCRSPGGDDGQLGQQANSGKKSTSLHTPPVFFGGLPRRPGREGRRGVRSLPPPRSSTLPGRPAGLVDVVLLASTARSPSWCAALRDGDAGGRASRRVSLS